MDTLRLPWQTRHDPNEAVRKVQGIRDMLAPGDSEVLGCQYGQGKPIELHFQHGMSTLA